MNYGDFLTYIEQSPALILAFFMVLGVLLFCGMSVVVWLAERHHAHMERRIRRLR